MKKIENFTAKARKVKGEGVIEYCLWVDGVGNLYVQFEDNETNTRVPGTFTGLLFPVARYANLRNLVEAIHEPTGYDIATERWETANGRNNPGFLKAVLQHLLP